MNDVQNKSLAKRYSFLIIVFLFVGILLYTYVGSATVPKGQLSIEIVKKISTPIKVKGNGKIAPVVKRKMTSPSDAFLKSVLVRPGKSVKKGELLLTLSSPNLEEKKESILNEIEDIKINNIIKKDEWLTESLVAKEKTARARLVAEQKALRKVALERLFEIGSISKSQVDEAKLEAEYADFQLLSSRKLEGNLKESHENQKLAVDKKLAQLDRELQKINKKVEALSIRSPIDGIVQKLTEDVGAHQSYGTDLATVVSLNQMFAEIYVVQSDVGKIEKGDAVNVGNSQMEVAGVVTHIRPIISNGMATISVALSQTQDWLIPDLEVRATITTKRLKETLAIKNSKNLNLENESLLYVMTDPEQARLQEIHFGREVNGYTEVLSGADVGSQIILEGLGKSETETIRVLK